jgi:hypothetical protein
MQKYIHVIYFMLVISITTSLFTLTITSTGISPDRKYKLLNIIIIKANFIF